MIHPARQHLLDATRRSSAGDSDLFARVQSAAHDADTSPFSRRNPTQAQLEANSYRTGRVDIQGLPIRIETPRGARREKPGKFSNLMLHHYGDVAGTVGNDGDPIDVFIGPFPELPVVYVVNQVGRDRAFDEHKVCMGFASEADARMGYLSAYAPGWDGLDSIVRATMAQFKWWLKYGDKSRPFTPDVLPYEGQTTMDKVLWNSQAEPVTKPLNTIIYELRWEDAGHGLMLDALSMAELMADPDIEAVPVLDAMVVEVGRLQPKMEILQRIMAAAGETVKPTEMAISDPVRYKGAAQVMVLFTMSDGQTVSVWFHNPDTTPAKLMPLDELISWKWMLNKKDVTIVVAPERGRDLNPREVSRRIMRLVERNSAAFLKANTKVAEKAAQLQALDTEIAELQTELTDVQRQIEVAKVEKETRVVVVSGDPHYSDRILKALMDAGWNAGYFEGAGETGQMVSVSREFVGVGPLGTMVSKDGMRRLFAGYSKDQAKRRYIALTLGDTQIADWDGRDQDPVEVARLVNEAAEKYADQARLKNGLPALYGVAAGDADATRLAPELDLKGFTKAVLPGGTVQLEYVAPSGVRMMFAIRGVAGGKFQAQYGTTSTKSAHMSTIQEGIDWADQVRTDVLGGPVVVNEPAPTAKRSPAVERAYAIAGILMTQYGWSKSDENEYPESGIFVDSPRGMNWVKLWADGVELRIDKSRSLLANPSVDESVEAIAASLDAGDARATEAAKPVPDPAPEPNPSPEPTSGSTPEPTDAEKVDAAYKFANASDAFKSEVAGSIGQESYSPFLSAKNIDEAAKKHGATVTWRLAMVLDSVGEAGDDEDPDEDDDFDVEAEFDACPDGDDAVLDALILDGDHPGHAFRGNQHVSASGESRSAVRSSQRAKHAEKHGDPKAQKKAHKTAYFSHMAAAEEAKGVTRSYHRKMAKFHGGRAGVVLDSVEESLILDDADAYESIVGTIKKGSKIVGRAHVGGDGKSMIFLGKTGKTRVAIPSGMNDGQLIRNPMYSDDDVGYLVDALFTVPENGVAKAEPVPADDGNESMARATVIRADDLGLTGKDRREYVIEELANAWGMAEDEVLDIPEVRSALKRSPSKDARTKSNERAVEKIKTLALKENERFLAGGEAEPVPVVDPAPVVAADPDPVVAPTPAVPADNDLTRLNALKKLAPKEREAVTSDDPRAIEKLQAKLNYLVAYGDMMRKANKLVRKNDRIGLTAMGFNGRTLESLFEKDFAGRIGFADYEMTNNNGVIRTTRLRLEELQAAEMARKVEPPVEPAPTTGTPGTTMQDPQKATDTAYLQSLIDGTGDLLAEDTFEKLEPMFTTYEGDAEMMALLERAAEAYGDAAVEAAKQALAT